MSEGKNLPSERPKSESLGELLPTELPAEWNVSPRGKAAISTAISMKNTKHGLYASIPMVCKGDKCPYADVCPLLQQDMAPEGERCPLEIADILNKFQSYQKELSIDENNIVDMSLLKDLIDIEVQLIRADKKMAIDGDFIQDIVVGISEATGEAITTPSIHKAIEYKDKLYKKRHDILQLLHSTRKDKAGDKLTVSLDPSTYASQLMEQAHKMRNRKTIDVEVDE